MVRRLGIVLGLAGLAVIIALVIAALVDTSSSDEAPEHCPPGSVLKDCRDRERK